VITSYYLNNIWLCGVMRGPRTQVRTVHHSCLLQVHV
jgi:hypothetical protein